jgi:plastocyanin
VTTSRAFAPVIWGAILCLPLLACGGDNSPISPTPSTPAYNISIINGQGYVSDSNGSKNPAVDTVAAGTKVSWVWRNTGTEEHNVTAVGTPNFPGSPDLSGASKYSYTFTTPGIYNYQCTRPNHAAAGMIGTIVVQ